MSTERVTLEKSKMTHSKPAAHEKVLTVTDSRRNANQRDIALPPHTKEKVPYLQVQKQPVVGKMWLKKKEPSFTARKKFFRVSLCGNQYGGFSKTKNRRTVIIQ